MLVAYLWLALALLQSVWAGWFGLRRRERLQLPRSLPRFRPGARWKVAKGSRRASESNPSPLPPPTSCLCQTNTSRIRSVADGAAGDQQDLAGNPPAAARAVSITPLAPLTPLIGITASMAYPLSANQPGGLGFRESSSLLRPHLLPRTVVRAGHRVAKIRILTISPVCSSR